VSQLSASPFPPFHPGGSYCCSCLQVCVYDPQVEDEQIYQDLGTAKFEWDHPSPRSRPIPKTAIDIAHVSQRGTQCMPGWQHWHVCAL